MSVKGWFPDPSGRFSQRWYDGHRWSDQVVAANGTTITDALPDAGTPHPPPQLTMAVPPAAATAAPVVAAPAGVAPAGVAPAGVALAAKVRLRPGATLAVGALGVLLVALSLLGVPWVTDGPGFNFFDLTDAAWNAGSGELVIRAYAGGLAYVLLVGAVLGVVLAGLPLPGSVGGATVWRILVSLGSAVAVVLHTVTVARIFRGPADPGIGAWLGIVGYFVVILAMVIGHHRRRTV